MGRASRSASSISYSKTLAHFSKNSILSDLSKIRLVFYNRFSASAISLNYKHPKDDNYSPGKTFNNCINTLDSFLRLNVKSYVL